MIETIKTVRYRPKCDKCGWHGTPNRFENHARRDLDRHPCGEHREAHDSTGGFRGILGGRNRFCVCGAHYVSHFDEAFKCPRDKQERR